MLPEVCGNDDKTFEITLQGQSLVLAFWPMCSSAPVQA